MRLREVYLAILGTAAENVAPAEYLQGQSLYLSGHEYHFDAAKPSEIPQNTGRTASAAE